MSSTGCSVKKWMRRFCLHIIVLTCSEHCKEFICNSSAIVLKFRCNSSEVGNYLIWNLVLSVCSSSIGYSLAVKIGYSTLCLHKSWPIRINYSFHARVLSNLPIDEQCPRLATHTVCGHFHASRCAALDSCPQSIPHSNQGRSF